MQISITDCSGHVIRSFPSMVVFMEGGTVTEASGGTAPALQTGGNDRRSKAPQHTYAFRFKDFTFNAQNVFTGWVILAIEATVDHPGDTTTGSPTVAVYMP